MLLEEPYTEAVEIDPADVYMLEVLLEKYFMWIDLISYILSQLRTKVATKIKSSHDHNNFCVKGWIKSFAYD